MADTSRVDLLTSLRYWPVDIGRIIDAYCVLSDEECKMLVYIARGDQRRKRAKCDKLRTAGLRIAGIQIDWPIQDMDLAPWARRYTLNCRGISSGVVGFHDILPSSESAWWADVSGLRKLEYQYAIDWVHKDEPAGAQATKNEE
jgi:hypothetical protein